MPIDPQAPLERLEFFVNDAALGVLITTGPAFDIPGSSALRILRLDSEADYGAAKSISSAVPAAEAFRPLPYSGKVCLLECVEEDSTWIFERYVSDRGAWANVVAPRDLSVIELRCDHAAILEERHLTLAIRKTIETIR